MLLRAQQSVLFLDLVVKHNCASCSFPKWFKDRLWSHVSLSAQSFPCPAASLILTSPEALSALSRLFPTVRLRGALFKSRK